MELVHWLFIIFGIALALTTQWCLLHRSASSGSRCATRSTEPVTQSAALLEECAWGSTPRPSLPAGSARLQPQAL